MRALAILIVAMVALGGCNTVQGVGRDVQGAGKVIESGAARVKRAVAD